MIKKVVLITLFILFAGVLIYGAVNRTTEKSDLADRIDGQNQGTNERHADGDELSSSGGQGQGNRGQGNQGQGNQGQGNQDQGNQGQGNQGQGSRSQGNQGQGNQGQGSLENGSGELDTGSSGSNGQGQGRNQQREAAEILEQTSISGVVTQAPAEGIDMILETADGEVLIGTGPGYLLEQGFVILTGDSVTVTGIWENEEFKAVEITLIDDGTSIILRDEWGRPMWSGAGRNARNRQFEQDSG